MNRHSSGKWSSRHDSNHGNKWAASDVLEDGARLDSDYFTSYQAQPLLDDRIVPPL